VISGNFIRAFANLFHTIINVYIIIIIIRSIISWMGTIPPNPFIMLLRRLTDPVFRLVHRHLPFMIIGGFDISPIPIVLVLYFVDNFITGLLLDYAGTLR
jgi:YggT family protein